MSAPASCPTPPEAPAYTASDFAGGLQRLLPRGRAWPREADAVQSQVLTALAPTLARLHARANRLVQDGFPSQPNGLLPEWEATLGLPDPCAGPEPTIALRQQQVLARLSARGGQSIPYFTAVTAALGYQITVTEFARSRFGRPFGQKFRSPAWSYTWQVNVAGITRRFFQFGQGKFGEPFSSWGNAVLECELRRIAPAHTVLTFAYQGATVPQSWNTAGAGWA